MEIPKSFLGYKRENGRAGTRNHVIFFQLMIFQMLVLKQLQTTLKEQ